MSVLAVTRDAFPMGDFNGKPRNSKTKSNLKLVKPSKLLVREDEDIFESSSEEEGQDDRGGD